MSSVLGLRKYRSGWFGLPLPSTGSSILSPLLSASTPYIPMVFGDLHVYIDLPLNLNRLACLLDELQHAYLVIILLLGNVIQ